MLLPRTCQSPTQVAIQPGPFGPGKPGLAHGLRRRGGADPTFTVPARHVTRGASTALLRSGPLAPRMSVSARLPRYLLTLAERWTIQKRTMGGCHYEFDRGIQSATEPQWIPGSHPHSPMRHERAQGRKVVVPCGAGPVSGSNQRRCCRHHPRGQRQPVL